MFFYTLEFENNDGLVLIEEITSTFDILDILRNKYPNIKISVNL